jgi:hypothetical protein
VATECGPSASPVAVDESFVHRLSSDARWVLALFLVLATFVALGVLLPDPTTQLP